jgi:hypothetical protein
MQIPFLSDVTINCESITPIHPPVEFDCVVEGKKLKATITHQEDNGFQFIYHISFSDGHAATFVASIQGGKWNDHSFASVYAKAIHDDLNAFCGFVPKRPPFAIRLKSEKDAFNVWVVPHVFKAYHYYVFYQGDYRFEVRKTKVWEAKTVREGNMINQEIASLVCRNIEQRLLQPQLL